MIRDITAAGGHYAIINRYRHPSLAPLVAQGKGKRSVFDVEKIAEMAQSTLSFIEQCGRKGQVILFVSTRYETVDLVEQTAKNLSLPYMLNRWIGGTLTNFKNIRSRLNRLAQLEKEQKDGKWKKYTKKEKVLMKREMTKLEGRFSGIASMENPPAAIFILDTRKEKNAVTEATQINIPIIGFSNADADKNLIQHPIIANIQSRQTVEYILSLVEKAYKAGAAKKGAQPEQEKEGNKKANQDTAKGKE